MEVQNWVVCYFQAVSRISSGIGIGMNGKVGHINIVKIILNYEKHWNLGMVIE